MQDARNVRLRLTPPASAQNGWHTALVRTAGALGAAMTTTYSTRCVAADLARRVLNAVLAVPAGRSEGMSTRRLHFALPEVWRTHLWYVPAEFGRSPYDDD